MSGLGSPEFWIILGLFLWGCYHRGQHRKYRQHGPRSTATTGEGFRVYYKKGRTEESLDVPSAKTESDALRYAIAKHGLGTATILRVEKL